MPIIYIELIKAEKKLPEMTFLTLTRKCPQCEHEETIEIPISNIGEHELTGRCAGCKMLFVILLMTGEPEDRLDNLISTHVPQT